jgi:hypothetical protein
VSLLLLTGRRSRGSPLRRGLLAYWSLEEVSGNRADSSGNGHTLTPASALSRVAGVVGFGCEFPGGANEWMDAASPSTLAVGSGSFFISLWFKSDNPNDDHAILHYGTDLTTYEYKMLKTDASIFVQFGGASVGALVALDPVPMDGTWHNIKGWYDADNDLVGSRLDNGTPVTSPLTSVTAVPGSTFRLGDSVPENQGPFIYLDEVGLWNRMLTEDEQSALYNGGAGLAWPLAYTPTWPGDELTTQGDSPLTTEGDSPTTIILE